MVRRWCIKLPIAYRLGIDLIRSEDRFGSLRDALKSITAVDFDKIIAAVSRVGLDLVPNKLSSSLLPVRPGKHLLQKMPPPGSPNF